MNSCESYEEIATNNDSKESLTSIMKQSLIGSVAATQFFMGGLAIGSVTVLIPQMRQESNSTNIIDNEMASWLYSMNGFALYPWIIILPIATDHWGRKLPQLATSVCSVVMFIILYLSQNPYHILICEVFLGFLFGGNITYRILTIIDYTSPEYRGIFLIIKSASGYWGIWVANAIGTFYPWRYIAVLGFICSIYTFNVLIWPESPYWLAKKGRYGECKASYQWLHGCNARTDREIRYIISMAENQKLSKSIRFVEMLKSKEFYKPTLLCIIMIFQYNFSGKVVCSLYILDIFKSITGGDTAAYTAMLILDGITVFGMYFGTYLSKILNRRTLYLGSSFIAVSLLFLFALYLFLVKSTFLDKNVYIMVVLLTLFSLTISCGPAILALSIYGELIPIKFQATCYVIAGLTYATCYSLLIKFAPLTFAYFGLHGTFLFYGITCGLCTVYLYFFMPETKNRSREEIERLFQDKKTSVQECTPLQ